MWIFGHDRFRFLPTPHVPHGWDAGVLFEENERTLFCSDLFHQWGHHEPATDKDILERCQDALREAEAGPFANYVPYTHHTGRVLESLAEQGPKTLASHAWLELLRQWGTGTARLICRNAPGARAQRTERTSNLLRHAQNIEQYRKGRERF
jgi:hypothetical protein